MKKLAAFTLITAALLVSLSGCVTKTDAENSNTDGSANNSAEEKELNIYTALEEEQLTDYLTEFKEQNPDITVNVTRDSTGVITAKLLAEKENPTADVVWGLSATSLLVLSQNSLLEGYAPQGVERILPEFKDTAEIPAWVGIDAWETAFLVNKEVLKSKGVDTVPRSYEDLLDPKYKGLIVMSNPASSGTGLLTVNGILQLMGEQNGWDYLDKLNSNVSVYMHSGSQPAKATASGEYGIGVSFGYRCIQSANETGTNICEAVFPSEGSGWDMEANALIKKSGEKEISKKFLDWAISDNIMKKYGENYPIVAIGAGDNIPEGYAINPMDQLIKGLDFNKAASERETILTEWSARYDGKSEPKK